VIARTNKIVPVTRRKFRPGTLFGERLCALGILAINSRKLKSKERQPEEIGAPVLPCLL